MPVAGGGFEQCYNAQAAVAAGSMLVVAVDVVQAPNDKQQLEPMLSKIGALPEELGEAETLLADTVSVPTHSDQLFRLIPTVKEFVLNTVTAPERTTLIMEGKVSAKSGVNQE